MFSLALSLLVGPSVCPSVLACVSLFSSWISFIPQGFFFTSPTLPSSPVPNNPFSSTFFSSSSSSFLLHLLVHKFIGFFSLSPCCVVHSCVQLYRGIFLQFYYPASKARYAILCWLIPKYDSLFNYHLALPLVSDTRLYLSFIWIILLCVPVLLTTVNAEEADPVFL